MVGVIGLSQTTNKPFTPLPSMKTMFGLPGGQTMVGFHESSLFDSKQEGKAEKACGFMVRGQTLSEMVPVGCCHPTRVGMTTSTRPCPR